MAIKKKKPAYVPKRRKQLAKKTVGQGQGKVDYSKSAKKVASKKLPSKRKNGKKK